MSAPKYEIGDTVMFKVSFKNPTCGLADKAGQTAKITGYTKAYSNTPTYYIDNDTTTAYPEYCFSGRYEEDV